MTKNDVKEVNVQRLQQRVDSLYEFRDNYFVTHSAENAGKIWENVEAELERLLREFSNEKIKPKEKAIYLYLVGRALNVTQKYKPEAEEVLTKATELDSKLYQAWNELGETYCKKNSPNEAKNCFLKAVEQKNNKESLRNLSILMRTKDFWNLKNGLKYAKKAVELDPKDGKSWLILGNAYICLYSVKQNPEILKMCKTAYRIAEKDDKLKTDACLYYNRGIVEKFQDDYGAALVSFERAEALDPTWKDPEEEKRRLLDYLNKAQELANKNVKFKVKTLKKLLKTSEKNRNRKLVYLKDLKYDRNKGKVVVGIVAGTFPEESRFNLSVVDFQESSAIVNIYNLPDERGILVGTIIAIPDPVFAKVQINGNYRNYEFDTIRVENASAITIDGKPVSSKKTNIFFSTTSFPD